MVHSTGHHPERYAKDFFLDAARLAAYLCKVPWTVDVDLLPLQEKI
jgi:hypothetical protein